MSAQVMVGNSETISRVKSVPPARRDSGLLSPGNLNQGPTGSKDDTERAGRKIDEAPPKRFLRVEDIWV